MATKTITLGLLSIFTVSMLTAFAMHVRASDPLCYIRTSDGKVTDLSRLCNQPASQTPAAQTDGIDLNAPVTGLPVGSEAPSELWNSISDLPLPPTQGATTPVASQPGNRMMPSAQPDSVK
jgi:hypothetical protein